VSLGALVTARPPTVFGPSRDEDGLRVADGESGDTTRAGRCDERTAGLRQALLLADNAIDGVAHADLVGAVLELV
jgi:hypothetical protein